MPTRHHSAAAIVLVAAAACHDAPASPSSPPDESARQLSTAISQAIAVAFGTYFPGAEPVKAPTACPRTSTDGAFACAPAAMGALSYTLSYTVVDAAGRQLATPDGRAASLRAVIDVRGTRRSATDNPPVTTDVVDHREIVVSELQSTTRTLTGTSVSRYDVVRGGADSLRSTQNVVGATTNLRFDDGARWPRAGNIATSDVTTVQATGDRPATTLRSRSAIEFDGSSIVTLSTLLEGSTVRCRFDLTERVATTCAVTEP